MELDANQELLSARQFLASRDLAGAETAARNVVQVAAGSAEAHHLLARSLLLQGKVADAAPPAQEALKLAEGYAEAHHTLAQIRLAQNDVPGALAGAARAVELAPSYAEAFHTLALCQIASERDAEALAAAAQAVQLVPGYAEAHLTRARLLARLRRDDEAEASLRAALAAKADYVEALNELGVLLLDHGRLEEAERTLRAAVGHKADYADAQSNLGLVLRAMGRADEAARVFKVAHDLIHPDLVLRQPEGTLGRMLDTGRRYARVGRDILRWHRDATKDCDAWVEYQLLHQATNGVSSDVFSRMLRTVDPTRGRQLPFAGSAIFPWIGAGDVEKIVATLERDGMYVFDRPIAGELVDRMQAFAQTTEANLSPRPAAGRTRAVFDPERPLSSGYLFDEAQLLGVPVVQQFMGDPLILDVCERYLGVEPRLAYVHSWWSAVFGRTPSCQLAQLFHADLSHMKWLLTFVYMTDVTAGTGPHTFVKGTHRPDEAGVELRRRGLVRVSDEDIRRAYGDRVTDITGPRGTVILADTRAFHKGNLPRTGHRLMFQLYHVNSLYPDTLSPEKRPLTPVEPALVEAIRQRPGTFAGYGVQPARKGDLA